MALTGYYNEYKIIIHVNNDEQNFLLVTATEKGNGG